MARDKIGVIHGRFQGLHNGHLEYLLAGKERCEYLVIGITNYTGNFSDERISRIDDHRLSSKANPFTYFERMKMIESALLENGISKDEFCIVPFPIEKPDELFNFVPRDAVFYATIYDDWGREKVKVLKNLGLSVDVMWVRSLEEKPISGSLLREKIIEGQEWESLVPSSVAEFIKANKLDVKLKENLK